MRKIVLLSCLLALLLGCSGEQSALAPRGEEASEIGRLFWTMAIFLALVLLGVLAARSWRSPADRAPGRVWPPIASSSAPASFSRRCRFCCC
jgi:hypothetical protein